MQAAKESLYINYMDIFKSAVKSLLVGILLVCISGCTSVESNGVWKPYSWSTEEEKLYYWFMADSYPTYDKCIKAAKYLNSQPNSSPASVEPVGCGLVTDNFYEAVYGYYRHAQREHINCIFESYNPNANLPYVMLLVGYPIKEGQGECVW
ncbi:MAG: Uncharacterised protein [Marinobacterium sp. xm-d-530]|nr:MAG: Uncharacterised protein [Marinobacterium sp. xm-d-530]